MLSLCSNSHLYSAIFRLLFVNGGKDTIETTPLMIAVRRVQDDMIKKMLRAGANANVKDKKGRTYLMFAISCYKSKIISAAGCVRIARLLLENGGKATINDADSTGETALRLAVKADRWELIRLLRDFGVEERPDADGVIFLAR